MKSLRIPQVLVVVTIGASAALSCAPRPSPSDAQSDASPSDVAQADTSESDAGACTMQDVTMTPPFNTTVCGREADGGLELCGAPCANGSCSAGCRLCVNNEFSGNIGIACSRRAGSTASCPGSVCQASDCPTGCETCVSPLFCIPDQTMADGATPACVGTTCDPANGCGAGCRAVG